MYLIQETVRQRDIQVGEQGDSPQRNSPVLLQSTRLCSACFDGRYPIELPSETALGKNVIEQMLANAAREAEHLELTREVSPEAEQAAVLRHP